MFDSRRCAGTGPEQPPFPGRAGRARWESAAAIAVAVAGVLLVYWWLHSREIGGPAGGGARALAADALDGYLPDDTAAVYTLRVRALLRSRAYRRYYHGKLPAALARDPIIQRGMALTGIQLSADVEWAQAVVGGRDVTRPLLLFRGQVDPGRFQLGPGALERADEAGGVYRYRGREGTAYLAAAGEFLVASADESRVEDALAHAAAPAPARPRHEGVRRLLAEVDQRQTLWLAVSFDALGPLPRLSPDVLNGLLRPVITKAESVRGGVTVRDDLEAEFRFRARDAGGAEAIEAHLREHCEAAPGAALLADPALHPLLDLLGTGKTERDGNDVILRCRLDPVKEAPPRGEKPEQKPYAPRPPVPHEEK